MRHRHSPRRVLARTARPASACAAALAALLSSACSAAGADAAAELEATLGQAAQPIIGGAPDESTSAVVGLALDLGTHVAGHCSGTLIAPNLVLTARHCVAFTENTDEQGVVECDSSEFRSPFPARLLLASPSPVRPDDPADPSYVRGREIRTLGDGDQVCGYDIALIILEDSVSPAIVPIAPRLERSPLAREEFSTVGFGLTSLSDPSSDGTRQRADGSAVGCSGEQCVAVSGGSIRSSEWASLNAPICSGDSGGPALDQSGRVIGVASRGDPTCVIAVFGDVSAWAPFIVDGAREAARVGRYPMPDWAEQAEDASPPDAVGAIHGDRGGCSVAPGRPAPNAAPVLAGVLGWLAWRLRRRTPRAPGAHARSRSSASRRASIRGSGCGPGPTTCT